MQSEPLLISSAKIGVLARKELSRGDIVLLFFALTFVLFGAADLISRVFRADTGTPVPATGVMQGQVLLSGLEQPFAPTHLAIPSMYIDASIESVGKKEDGTMKSPSTFDTVGWFNEGSLVGAHGNVVLAGHLNNALDTSGVFEHLDNLSLGAEIIVSDQTGREARYVVREMTVYDAYAAPADTIFATSGPARLVLITCNGAWDKGKRSYDKRLVVYADLVSGK